MSESLSGAASRRIVEIEREAQRREARVVASKRHDCPFCDYAGPSTVLYRDRDCLVFEPLRPIVPGHVLVVPRAHATDFAHNPSIAAAAMRTAGEFAQAEGIGDANIITSMGASASQTVRHLHLHIIPRFWNDGVRLPWTNPNPKPILLEGEH